jgi:23S rRNA (guanosine2251-2'-O)-methyltransferase
VVEGLRGRRTARTLYLAEGIKEEERVREALALARARGLGLERIPRIELDELCGGTNHQGLGLLAGRYPYATVEEIAERDGTVLVLDHIQDLHNMGTLLRAAEAAGVAGVVIARDRAADVTPATVNASAGAVEHLLVARESNLARTIEDLKQTGRWAIALDTGPDAVDLFTGSLPLPAILVVGAEGPGLTPIVRKACDLIAAIPMTGKVASLNAATAGSIALFEIMRRARTSA